MSFISLSKHRSVKTLLAPAFIIFLSANIANVANLAFNMIFARALSPAQFADLTLLLTLKLGLLSLFSAVQFGISDIVAKQGDLLKSKTLAASFSWKSFRYSLPLCIVIIVFADFLGELLNFKEVGALILLSMAIPLFLPLVIYRGLAQGRLDLPKMVGSFQAEWIIRLAGCWLLWIAGFGLFGITVALVASIVIALLFSMDKDDFKALRVKNHAKAAGQNGALIWVTLPYAGIFLAQILALDGDIFIAKTAFPADEAGAAAGLLLIQRIFFFAFLSFATIVQPMVASPDSSDKENRTTLFRLLSAMAVISIAGLSIIAIKPDLFVQIFLGSKYLTLAPLVILAGVIGVTFMAAHLSATVMIARGQRKAPLFLLALVAVQYSAIALLSFLNDDFGLTDYIWTKAAVLVIGALIMASLALRPMKAKHAH